jgi:integrase
MKMNQNIYTIPKICNSKNLKTKAYVTFYYDNKQVREYTAKSIGLKIFPGRAKTIAERTSLLKSLCKELTKSLVSGTYKKVAEPIVLEHSLLEVLAAALQKKQRSALSDTYKRDLRYIHDQFIDFLTDQEKNGSLSHISTQRIEAFLEQFSSSNTYYMNKRTDLGTLFTTAGRALNIEVNAVNRSQRKKPKAKLNVAYDQGQVRPLLEYLQQKNPKLYICCMLTYSTWLRPHIEIRKLTRSHFSNDYALITLSGKENKSGRVRVVYVPPYAQQPLKEILDGLQPDLNIFSGQVTPMNPDYFKTVWNRLRKDMLVEKLIRQDQTIYSFRHTAAVLMYRKTKDIYLLQKLLGHQSITVC